MTAPGQAEVAEVAAPRPHGGEVVVEVERAGVCGTDVELFHGTLAYVVEGATRYPIRPGHEWCGRVRAVGAGVDRAWLGRWVVGDTMLGCGHCLRCRSGRHHVCADRTEIGVRGDQPGALAERLALPASALHAIPEVLSPAAGALVEPAGNALRAVRATGLSGGEEVLVLGAGTIGLLCAAFAAVHGARVTVADPRSEGLALADGFGAAGVDPAALDDASFAVVIDASTGPPVRPRRSAGSSPAARWCCWAWPARPASWTPGSWCSRMPTSPVCSAPRPVSTGRSPGSRPARSSPTPWWPGSSGWTRLRPCSPESGRPG